MAARDPQNAVADADSGSRLYDADFYEWCITMAELLRAGRIDQVDIEHVAEEIEDLGKSQYRELDSRTTVLILHLLKARYQPGKHTCSWDQTIRDRRIEIRGLLRYNPSLRRALAGAPARVYNDAVDKASNESDLPADSFPPSCPFSAREIFGSELCPGE
jgi:hypothetical protein